MPAELDDAPSRAGLHPIPSHPIDNVVIHIFLRSLQLSATMQFKPFMIFLAASFLYVSVFSAPTSKKIVMGDIYSAKPNNFKGDLWTGKKMGFAHLLLTQNGYLHVVALDEGHPNGAWVRVAVISSSLPHCNPIPPNGIPPPPPCWCTRDPGEYGIPTTLGEPNSKISMRSDLTRVADLGEPLFTLTHKNFRKLISDICMFPTALVVDSH